jgi:hypothetical protein
MRSRFRIATIAHPLVVRSNVAGLAVSSRQETEVASTRTSRPTFASDCIISLTCARLPYRETLRSGQTNRSSRQSRVITIRHRTIRSKVAYSDPYGDGHAAERIVERIRRYFAAHAPGAPSVVPDRGELDRIRDQQQLFGCSPRVRLLPADRVARSWRRVPRRYGRPLARRWNFSEANGRH